MTRTQKRRDQRKRHKARIKYWQKTRLYLAEAAFDEWRKTWRAKWESLKSTDPKLRQLVGARRTGVSVVTP